MPKRSVATSRLVVVRKVWKNKSLSLAANEFALCVVFIHLVNIFSWNMTFRKVSDRWSDLWGHGLWHRLIGYLYPLSSIVTISETLSIIYQNKKQSQDHDQVHDPFGITQQLNIIPLNKSHMTPCDAFQGNYVLTLYHLQDIVSNFMFYLPHVLAPYWDDPNVFSPRCLVS